MSIECKNLGCDREEAKAAALRGTNLSAVVARLSAGDLAAQSQLARGLGFCTYDVSSEFIDTCRLEGRYFVDHFIGEAHVRLYRAIESLEKKDDADPEDYVRRFLYRGLRSMCRKESIHIYVPSSTKSTRKAAGQEPYKPLRRRLSIDSCSAEFRNERRSSKSCIEHPCIPKETQCGKPYRLPSKYLNQSEEIRLMELEEELAKIAVTPQESQFIDLMADGNTLKQTSEALGIPYIQAKRMRSLLRKRAQKTGLLPSPTKTRQHQAVTLPEFKLHRYRGPGRQIATETHLMLAT